MEHSEWGAVFGLVLPFVVDAAGLLRVAAVSRALRNLVALDERVWRKHHLLSWPPDRCLVFRRSWRHSYLASQGQALPPGPVPTTSLVTYVEGRRAIPPASRGAHGGDDGDELRVALLDVSSFHQHESEEGTPALLISAGARLHYGEIVAADWKVTLSADTSPFARDDCFMPAPSHSCFLYATHQQASTADHLTMKLQDFMHYAAHNRDEKPLCAMHDLSATGSAIGEHIQPLVQAVPRNAAFFSGDLFDALGEKRPPKDFLCMEPTGGGVAWQRTPYGQSMLDVLVTGLRRWAFYPPGYPPPGVRFLLSEEEEEARDMTSSPYRTPSTLRWLAQVYTHLTDDDYRPVECLQTAGQTLYVPAGWWMASLSIDESCAAAISLRSHYASATQLEELWSALPPSIFVGLKNRLWDQGRADIVRQIDTCMGTPGRAEAARVLRRIGAVLARQQPDTVAGAGKEEDGDDACGPCEVTKGARAFPLQLLDEQDLPSKMCEAPRHSHVNPTFSGGDRVLVKFYHRRVVGHYHREAAFLRYLSSLPASIAESRYFPVLYAQGTLRQAIDKGEEEHEEEEEEETEEESGARWEWPYLVISYAEGETLESVWEEMTAAEKETIASELGRLVSLVHATPITPSPSFPGAPPPSDTHGRDAGLPASWADFIRFMSAQRAKCVRQHRLWDSLPPHLLAEVDDYLPSADSLPSFLSAASVAGEHPAVWLHSDLTATNLIMRATRCDAGRETARAVKISGLIDFGDAKVGHRVYDLVAAHVLVFRCDKSLLRLFMNAYLGSQWRPKAAGNTCDATQRSPGFARVAMCLTLLHEYDAVGAASQYVPVASAHSLDQLATMLWA